MNKAFSEGKMSIEEIDEVLNSYTAHMQHGHTYWLRKHMMEQVILNRHE